MGSGDQTRAVGPSNRTGGGAFLRRSEAFVYGMCGKGFCFGMAVGVLLNFYPARTRRPSLVELPLTPDLLSTLREHQLRQFRIRMVLAAIRDWAASELDPSLGKDATLKEVLDSGALGKEGPDAPESLSAKRRKKKGE